MICCNQVYKPQDREPLKNSWKLSNFDTYRLNQKVICIVHLQYIQSKPDRERQLNHSVNHLTLLQFQRMYLLILWDYLAML